MNSHNFFSNHYEKIILVGLLILFSGLLYWQLSVVQEAQKRKVDHIVNQKDPDADYQLANYETDEHYSAVRTFSGKLNWSAWENKDADSKIDMMVPPAMAPCPYCYWMISKDCFPKMDAKESKKCSHCNHVLKPRTSDTDHVQIAAAGTEDKNGNKIPDEWERQYGIFEQKDADPDQDGFSSLEEFLASPKTNPTDPKSHPAYATKLVLVAPPRTEPIENELPGDFKKGGEMRLARVDMDSKKAEFTFKPVKGSRYRAEVKTGEQIPYRRKNTTDRGKVPVSGFKLLSVESETAVKIVSDKDSKLVFTCEVGKPVMTPYAVVQLENLLKQEDNVISTKTGDKIVLGTEANGFEEYVVESANTGDKTTPNSAFVTLKNAAGKIFMINERGIVDTEALKAAEKTAEGTEVSAEK